jgi:hypothetical protein
MAAVEYPVLDKHYAEKPLNIFRNVFVNGTKMQEAIVVYFMFMFMAVPEGNYFQN